MARTTTRYVNFESFQAKGRSAATVVKLMMACNDLQLANEALSEWRKERAAGTKPRRIGAGMYFVRMQIAHLVEGMKIIEEIKKDAVLMALVRRCDMQTQQSFESLGQFLPFKGSASKVRSNLTFHYNEDGKLIMRAISERAGRSNAKVASITRGDAAYLWHFKAADEIVDDIVVRQIWGIPYDPNPQAAADEVADRLHQIFLSFMDFSGEFLWKYCERQ